jgi:hypothetical protein
MLAAHAADVTAPIGERTVAQRANQLGRGERRRHRVAAMMRLLQRLAPVHRIDDQAQQFVGAGDPLFSARLKRTGTSKQGC